MNNSIDYRRIVFISSLSEGSPLKMAINMFVSAKLLAIFSIPSVSQLFCNFFS